MSDPNKAAEEAAKAIQEVAKTGGKAIDAGQKFGEWLSPFVRGSVAQLAGIWEDKFKYRRWENQVRMIVRAQEFLHQRGLDLPTRTIPLKLALPLLEVASLEDDDAMRDRWAKLLVNWADANSGVEQNRVYAQILESIGPLEARILEVIFANPFDRMKNGVRTDELPDASPPFDDKPLQPTIPSKEIFLALSNLARLFCLSPANVFGGSTTFSIVVPTELGRAFVEAVTLRPR